MKDRRRQPLPEGVARETALSSLGDELRHGRPQRPLDQRLGHQGVDHVHDVGAAASGVVGDAAGDRCDLEALAGRQAVGRTPHALPGDSDHGPGRAAGPSRHAGQLGRHEGGQGAASPQIGERQRRRHLEEEGVAALAREQGLDAGLAAGGGDGKVVLQVPAVLARPGVPGGRLEQLGGVGDRRARPGREVDAEALRHGPGVYALVGLGRGGARVEREPHGAAQGRQGSGDDGGVQPARDLDADRATPGQGAYAQVERAAQVRTRLRGASGRPARDGLRGPERDGGPVDRRVVAGLDRGEAGERAGPAEIEGAFGQAAEAIPVEGDVRGRGGDHGVGQGRGEDTNAPAPPCVDGEGAGGIAEGGREGVVGVAEQDDVAAPAGAGAPGGEGRVVVAVRRAGDGVRVKKDLADDQGPGAGAVGPGRIGTAHSDPAGRARLDGGPAVRPRRRLQGFRGVRRGRVAGQPAEGQEAAHQTARIGV